MTDVASAPPIAEREAVYRASSPVERALVEVLSLTYGWTTRSQVLAAVRKAGFLRDPGGKALNSERILPVLEQLAKAGVLELRQHQFRCHPLLAGSVVRGVVERRALPTLLRAIREAPVQLDVVAEVWIALHERAFERVESILRSGPRSSLAGHPLHVILQGSFDPRLLAELPDALVAEALDLALVESLEKLAPLSAAGQALRERAAEGRRDPRLSALIAAEHVLRGRPGEAIACLSGVDTPHARAVRAWPLSAACDIDASAAALEECAGPTAADTAAMLRLIQGLTLVFRVIARFHRGDFAGAEELLKQRLDAALWLGGVQACLFAVAQVGALRRTAEDYDVWRAIGSSAIRDSPLEQLFSAVAWTWLGKGSSKVSVTTVESLRAQAEEADWGWPAAQLAELSARLRTGEAGGASTLLDAMANAQPWQRALQMLERMAARPPEPPAAPEKPRVPATDARLAWFLTLVQGQCQIRPMEQKAQAKGGFTGGRLVALERLQQGAARMPFLTPADLRIISALSSRTYRNNAGYPETIHTWDTLRALAGMVGHPAVFLDSDPSKPVEVAQGSPALTITEEGADLVLRLSPVIHPGSDHAAVRESETRVKFVRVDARLKELAQALGDALRVPRTAGDRVSRLLGPLSAMVAVHSTVVSSAKEALPERPADSTPWIRLRPHAGGLAVEVQVRPLGDLGPRVSPGVGAEVLIVEVEGQSTRVRRDLGAEAAQRDRVEEACPTLQRWASVGSERVIADRDACLDLLLELEGLGGVRVDWAQGAPFKVHPPVSAAHLAIRLDRDLRASGGLSAAPGVALDLPALLDFISVSPSRYVPLGEGEFVALTADLRQKLDDLAALVCREEGSVRLHPLSLGALSDWAVDGPFRGDKDLKRLLGRIREAAELVPEVPSTLAGELRDYQVEGFRWLLRLAHWGAGACLADDMGLGKTIQILAVLLARSRGGPALVVAPTSVCPTWVEEARRFAPTLRCVELAGSDREKIVSRARAFDVVIASYGLLVEEQAILIAKAFHTVVLDEAQAIKNPTTKRSQAAFALQGAFKVAATGTPVENHAGELWSLFRFINPGLFGSQGDFDARFAVPILKKNDRAALDRLKRIARPFILRRSKAQVLPELPPRTDVVRYVELGPEEAALYEALRGRALEALSREGVGQVQVLAEIMKLRRACCHPRLVLPGSPLTSAKLSAFTEIVEELGESRHRALVFSQFVDHLTVVRGSLDEKGIRYQYLDGATPAGERKKRVEAFQAGEGELFLISLRAGGVGLNLTAADYVIHLDPWWNPAVEQQASDRAHRIGQERPVTVYRLVARHTIEERILALHERKRALADSLLEGVDVGAKVSVEELLDLLREEGGGHAR